MTEIQAALQDVVVLSHDNSLPISKELSPPFAVSSARYYFETHEGMRVSLDDGLVVGPTDADDRTWVVRADLGIKRIFHDDPGGTGEVICVDDNGHSEIQPEARVGDEVSSLIGVLDYRNGIYCMQLTAEPALQPGAEISEPPPSGFSGQAIFRVATFNLANLFDTQDDPLTEDQVLSLTEYQRRLQKRAMVIGGELHNPALLALQEVENSSLLQDFLARPEIEVGYDFVTEPGPDVRGLDTALLYRPDLVNLLSAQSHQGCTNLVDGFEPDGNGDPVNPVNSLTCDRDGDGVLDGNRLFSRPPLVGHMLGRSEVQPGTITDTPASTSFFDFWVVVTHFKSKVGDSPIEAYTLPRRLEQAQFIAGIVLEIHTAHPLATVIVLGDFNDHPNSQPMGILASGGLVSAAEQIDHQYRYTYNYRGISQTLDGILYLPGIPLAPVQVSAVHINVDYPYSYSSVNGTSIRSSDHEPLLADFIQVTPITFLPLSAR